MSVLDELAAFVSAPHFRVGQRVRPSAFAIDRGMFAGTYKGISKSDASGVVTAVDEHNSPMVLWDYRKTACGYFPGFIAIDKRRKREPRP